MLITVVGLVGKMGYCGELYLKDKFDAANLEQKHNSHGGRLDRNKLSSRLRVGRTSDLESWGSNGSIYMVHPLQS